MEHRKCETPFINDFRISFGGENHPKYQASPRSRGLYVSSPECGIMKHLQVLNIDTEIKLILFLKVSLNHSQIDWGAGDGDQIDFGDGDVIDFGEGDDIDWGDTGDVSIEAVGDVTSGDSEVDPITLG